MRLFQSRNYRLLCRFVFVVCALSLSSVVRAQDTVVVQTLTFDSTTRAGVFHFPDITNTGFEKVIMQYRMRCHGANVSDGSNRNKGCGEWDYNCETFITDSSRVDSLKTSSPDYVISNWAGGNFPYTTKTLPTVIRRAIYSNSDTANRITGQRKIQGTNATGQAPIDEQSSDSRSFYFYNSSDLIFPHKTEFIEGIKFIATDARAVNFQNVGIRIYLTKAKTLETALTTRDTLGRDCYYGTLTQNTIYFTNPVRWDSTVNMIIEINTQYLTPLHQGYPLSMSSTTGNFGLETIDTDAAIAFTGAERVPINPRGLGTPYEVTYSFWAKGDPTQLPGANNVALEGLGASGERQVNVHLPWSDGSVYWDCGGRADGNFDRVSKPLPAFYAASQWNHWAFTKNALKGTMSIYLNGRLFASDTGKHMQMYPVQMTLGGAISSNLGYPGSINHFAVYGTALDSNEIHGLFLHGPTMTDTLSKYLSALYHLNEGSGRSVIDSVDLRTSSYVAGFPAWRTVHGADLHYGFSLVQRRPDITLFYADTAVGVKSVVSYAYDTLATGPHVVIHYKLDVNGKLVAADTSYRYQAGKLYTLDAQGHHVDSLNVAATDTVRIGQIINFQKGPQKFEIMSFVTPYGIGLDLGKNGVLYEFDVTDYLPIMRGWKRLSMERGSGQEEFDLRFLFIRGTPVRPVLNIQQVWPMTEENYQTIQANDRYQPIGVKLDPNASGFKIRSFITGHGQQGEFTPIDHSIMITDRGQETDYTRTVWKECSSNPLYPQGGTWVYSRAGWCPGAATDLAQFDITDKVRPGDSIKMDYNVLGGSGDSRYDPSTQLVSYGAPSWVHDAAVIAIERPTNRIEFARFNPACDMPIAVIQNTGTTPLTSLAIEYYVQGGAHRVFNWHGSLNFTDTQAVALPVDSMSFWTTTDTNSIFHVDISKPNGVADQYDRNNHYASQFVTTPAYKGTIVLNLVTNKVPEQNYYEVLNAKGDTVFSNGAFDATKAYYDSLILKPGCYTLVFHDDGENGLSFFASPNDGNGSLKLRQDSRTGKILKNFNADFGKFIRYDFSVLASPLGVNDAPVLKHFGMYPNPAHGVLKLDFSGYGTGMYVLEVFDVRGARIKREQRFTTDAGTARADIDLHSLAAGNYFVRITTNSGTHEQAFVVE